MEYEVKRKDGKMIWYKLVGHSVVPVQVGKIFLQFLTCCYIKHVQSRSNICVASFVPELSRGTDCYNMISACAFCINHRRAILVVPIIIFLQSRMRMMSCMA
jgi:hypothetical protein